MVEQDFLGRGSDPEIERDAVPSSGHDIPMPPPKEDPIDWKTSADGYEKWLIEICQRIDPKENVPGRAGILVDCLITECNRYKRVARDLTKLLYDQLCNVRNYER